MQNTISLKKKYVRTDGWRGYEQPVFAAAGANDTGTWSDSPCPSDVCKKELDMFKARLRKEKISFKTTWGKTSNVFCIHRYVVVAEQDLDRAKEIAEELTHETRLLYVA
jgi:hypothetical protein